MDEEKKKRITCPIHKKDWDIIYPKKDSRLIKFLCGCVFYKKDIKKLKK